MTSLLTRSRLVAAVIFVISVALCAAAVKASESGHDFEQIPGVAGRQIDVQDGWLLVDDVQVATTLTRPRAGGETETIGTTQGMFVVARITVAATGSQLVSFSEADLVTRDRTYTGWTDTVATAATGFQTSLQAVWEVDPADIDDLTAQFTAGAFLTAYDEHPAVHLGITAENADQWRAAARGATVSITEGRTSVGIR